MYFNIRLLELIEYLGENANSFGKKLGLKNAENIRLLTLKENVNANPTLKILSSIVTLYPNINSRWLLTGEGEMLTSTEAKPYEIQEHVNRIDESKITLYTCPECIVKQQEINDLRQNNDDLRENLNDLRKLSLGKCRENG